MKQEFQKYDIGKEKPKETQEKAKSSRSDRDDPQKLKQI